MRNKMPIYLRFMKVYLKSLWPLQGEIVTPCFVDAACGAALLQKGLAFAGNEKGLAAYGEWAGRPVVEDERYTNLLELTSEEVRREYIEGWKDD